MNNYFALPKLQQRQILEQATLRIKLPVQAIEKDIWVSTILTDNFLFTRCAAPDI